MLTGPAALGVNTVLANTEPDATENMNEHYELTLAGVSCGVSHIDYLQRFMVCLGLEINKYCKLMSRNARVSSKRCKHAFGNHKPERWEGYNHIPHG